MYARRAPASPTGRRCLAPSRLALLGVLLLAAPTSWASPEAIEDPSGPALEEGAEPVADAEEVGGEAEEEAAPEDEPAAEPAPEAAEAPEDAQEDEDRAAGATDPEAAFQRGDHTAAAAAWATQVADQPEVPALRYRLAVAEALAGRLSTATEHAAHVERIDPGNPAATELAIALRVVGARTADGPADEHTLRVARARRALADGRLRTAERLAAQALDALPDRAGTENASIAELQRIRGLALVGLGRMTAGAAALKSAVGAGHHDPALWRLLADTARRAQREHQAAVYEQLAEGAPPAPPIPAEEESP